VVSVRRALSALGVALLLPGNALAQGEGRGPAQTQFDYGLAEMQAGRYASGCPALAESYRIDPHPGVLFTLAECENKWGKIASAVTHYEAYLDVFAHMAGEERARQRGRDRIATAQRDRLRLQVPQLAIALPASAPVGTTITRDGAPLGTPSLGAALPVDPGEHVVIATTPDGVAHEAHVTLAPAQHESFVVDLSAPPPVSAPVAPAPLPGAPPPPRGPSSWTWVAGGVGLAGVAVGAVAGILVLGDKSTIDAECPTESSCSQKGLNAASQSRTLGLVSDVGFAAGGVGLAAAAVLLLATPSRAVQPVATAGAHGGFVGARVAW